MTRDREARPPLVAAGLAVIVVLALGGCGSVRSALGIDKTSPDEFDVIRHAALATPPNFELRPPQPGAPRPQEQAPQDQARNVLLGTVGGGTAAEAGTGVYSPTPGEVALLKESGADKYPTNIRQVVRIESAALGDQDRSFTDTLMFWTSSEEEGQVLDAAAEVERLKQVQAGNEAPPTSAVVIKRKEGGLFGSLFE